MTGYYIWGLISSAFFLSSIPAILHQLLLIWKRRKLRAAGTLSEEVTQSISINQVFSSYCGVYSFFLFGFASQSPDPFLTYPRAIVGLLLYLIVLEIYQDRRSPAARMALTLCSLSLLVPILLITSGTRSTPTAVAGSNLIVCVATALMAQGAVSQYLLLKRAQTPGAVSLPMHVVLYGKDLSGMIFGLQIGADAWSIILMHASNLIMRAPIIYTYVRLVGK